MNAPRCLVLCAASVLAVLAIRGTWPPSASRDLARERASYAVGFSAGADFRGVLPVEVESLRLGLADGLGGEATQHRLMSRPELFSRIRQVMRRLSDAELAAVAARIDRDQER